MTLGLAKLLLGYAAKDCRNMKSQRMAQMLRYIIAIFFSMNLSVHKYLLYRTISCL
jgi:hypothetical protein